MTKEQITEYKEAFSVFDKDGDGTIAFEELGTVMRSLGKPQTERNLKEIFKNVDVNNDGKINFEEFLAMVRPKMDKANRPTSIKEVFRLVDKNSDGLISAEELKHVVKILGKDLTDGEIAKMTREADDDRDGQISYDEFDKFIAKLFGCHR